MPAHATPERYGENWTREELILAFDLYCRIPFAKTKANNPSVRELAQLLGRSAGSVARKLGNFGSFDPALKRRNISGLANTSELDEKIWNEFNTDWSALVLEADRLRSIRVGGSGARPTEIEEELDLPIGPSERVALAKQRIHQAFFRAAVLSGYESTCCITGINLPECLRASHIVPWAVNERFRADPTNGLCLSATFDRLFDAGLFTLDNDFKVCFSRRVVGSKNESVRSQLVQYHGRSIAFPKRFRPLAERLDWHRKNVFEH